MKWRGRKPGNGEVFKGKLYARGEATADKNGDLKPKAIVSVVNLDVPTVLNTFPELAKAVQKLFGETQIKVIGSRHGEKLYETLLTKEERLRAEDMGDYYRVVADSRDLNYDKFYVEGEVHTAADEAYTSHNTRRLDVDGTFDKLMTAQYVRDMLEKWEKN